MRSAMHSCCRLNILSKQRPVQSSKQKQIRRFTDDRFTPRVRELLPTAITRALDKPPVDEYRTVDPRAPRNRVVVKEDGQRYVVEKGGGLVPLYRDWEREFGKPIGDPRPYYRKHMGPLLMRYEPTPRLKSIPSLVVVEGLKDWSAVKKAVNAQIFVCDGTAILDHVFEKYVTRTVGKFQGDVIVLMDPDTAGRRLRTAAHTLIGPCKHAFVSEYEAVIGMGTNYESIGIQHCAPETILHALKNPKDYNEEGEKIIEFGTLHEMGLVQTSAERTEGVRLRRRFFCGLLGIGFCDGKQLVNQLNRYYFSIEEIEFALARANILVEEWKAKPWKLQKDYGRQIGRKDTLSISSNFVSAF